MWWIVSLIALVLLLVAAMGVTFFLMVALNGFPSLPDAFVIIYFAFTGVLIPTLSVLAGLQAKKLSKGKPQRLWLAGMLTTIVSLVIVPILLCGLTFGLLLAFGMI